MTFAYKLIVLCVYVCVCISCLTCIINFHDSGCSIEGTSVLFKMHYYYYCSTLRGESEFVIGFVATWLRSANVNNFLDYNV